MLRYLASLNTHFLPFNGPAANVSRPTYLSSSVRSSTFYYRVQHVSGTKSFSLRFIPAFLLLFRRFRVFSKCVGYRLRIIDPAYRRIEFREVKSRICAFVDWRKELNLKTIITFYLLLRRFKNWFQFCIVLVQVWKLSNFSKEFEEVEWKSIIISPTFWNYFV